MSTLGHVLDHAFGRPRGGLGRLGGAVLAHSDAATERHVVSVAKLGPDETVLVVGSGVGLAQAATRARLTIGIDADRETLARSARRHTHALTTGAVELREVAADATGQEDASVDVVISVNTLPLRENRAATLSELHRILRPGGRLVLSAHERWLPVPRHELADDAASAGFTDVQTWVWDPPGPLGVRAAQLRAWRAP